MQLALTEGIGPLLAHRLLERAGSAQEACQASVRLLREVKGIGSSAGKISNALRAAGAEVDAEIERADAAGVRLIGRSDALYPPLLREIPDPPLILYLKGMLEPRDLHAVAIVGSRRCTHYGREQAERFGALLSGGGLTVISGGARGIDSAAHRGALRHPNGRTIAVLGCGVDVVYPPENASLFDQIARQGAVITEFPMQTPPLRDNFPRRNRIVSGMSRGVLVIEADIRSGALITARQAADDHNRPVWALPGRVDSPLSAGTHKLIRDGATLVTGLEEILEGLPPLPESVRDVVEFKPSGESIVPSAPAISPQTAVLTGRQQLILSHVGIDPTNVDVLIERTGLDASMVLQELTFLTLRSAVKRVDGQTFVRKAETA